LESAGQRDQGLPFIAVIVLQPTKSTQKNLGIAERSEGARGVTYYQVITTECCIADRLPQKAQRTSSALQLLADIVHGTAGFAIPSELPRGAFKLFEKHITHPVQAQIA
jgi:hypothetical protein